MIVITVQSIAFTNRANESGVEWSVHTGKGLRCMHMHVCCIYVCVCVCMCSWHRLLPLVLLLNARGQNYVGSVDGDGWGWMAPVLSKHNKRHFWIYALAIIVVCYLQSFFHCKFFALIYVACLFLFFVDFSCSHVLWQFVMLQLWFFCVASFASVNPSACDATFFHLSLFSTRFVVITVSPLHAWFANEIF